MKIKAKCSCGSELDYDDGGLLSLPLSRSGAAAAADAPKSIETVTEEYVAAWLKKHMGCRVSDQ